MNAGVAERIVDAAGNLADARVVEVGPGRGALTTLLVRRAASVVALEIDPALTEELRALHGLLDMRLQDATEADWSALAGESPRVALVANLPYESGTAILQRWLAASARDARLDPAVVMLQREVAERIGAAPSTKAYGVLAVLAQATHRVKTVMDVAPGSFRPAPKVWSRVLRLDRRDDALFEPGERGLVTSLVHAAFAQRRKQLATALDGRGGIARATWQSLLRELGHEPTARAEELSPAQLVALARRSAPTS